MAVYVLGLSAFYHDAAACLIRDGQVIFAVEEERLSRIKHDRSYPERSISACLDAAGIGPGDVDVVVFYEKTLPKIERQLDTWIRAFPRSMRAFLRSMSRYLDGRVDLRSWLARRGFSREILFSEHHLSHAAFAFYTSPFDVASVLVADGVGEWTTTSLWQANSSGISPLREIHFPHSLGLFYSIVTAHLGFRVNEDEYKVMGLASYGHDSFADQMNELLPLHADGSFSLGLHLVDLAGANTMSTPALERLLGPPRRKGDPIEPRHQDLACSVQAHLERALDAIVSTYVDGPLCIAGGVGLNGNANARLASQRPIHVTYAPGDSGGAIGAAFVGANAIGVDLSSARDLGPYLGPAYSADEIDAAVRRAGLTARPLDSLGGLDFVADRLASGDILGWFQGRTEFGPRALGHRSILADPRDPAMRDVINDRVKHREPFRPFAPAILEERVADFFAMARPIPWMTEIHPILEERRGDIGAVVHIDGTGRLQTVSRRDAPKFHALIEAFAKKTGVPVVLNTSFNVAGEPIVCSPDDACRCFESATLDGLVLGDLWVSRGGV